MKNIKLMAAASLLVLTTGCAMTQTPVTGFLYTGVKAPVAVTSSVVGTKSGKACASSILGLFAFGDASIDAAKKSGGITEVSSVDYSSTSVLGLYGSFCAVVSGN